MFNIWKQCSMPKSSIDYAELAGLRIALVNATRAKVSKEVLDWLKSRIEELENI